VRLRSDYFARLTAASLFCFIASAASAQTISQAQLHGCWRHELLKKVGEKVNGFSDLCFRADGKVYHASITPSGGGDELLNWELAALNRSLIINGQTCHINQGSNDAALFLSQCLYMGAWVRQCNRMTDDGTGCARGN
jgi:hypothetical protein